MKHLILLSVMLLQQISIKANPADTLDFKGKTITNFIIYNSLQYLSSKPVGEQVIIKTENYKAIENDLMAWGRMVQWPVNLERRESSFLTVKITRGEQINKSKKLAIVISENGLEELLSPLGLAITCALSGYDVNIYFQGPSVRVLTKGFKEKLKGFNSIFSSFARNGLAKIGHAPVQDKLHLLQSLGAKFYICQPSMQHFGVNEQELVFKGVLCEYPTFLEVYNGADLKFFLQ